MLELLVLYGAFLMVVAAIFMFSKHEGRRKLILAGAVSGAMMFVLPFFYSQVDSAQMTLVQAYAFPFLVLLNWMALMAVAWLRNR